MSNLVRYYLAAYNFTAFVFWLLYFINFFGSGCVLNPTGLLLLNIAQGMAVLEILHAVLKWVRSPVGSTAAQVSSRILVLVLINFYAPYQITGMARAGLVTVSVAWSITEMVRYSFYFLGLFNRQPAWLLWIRYSFFIVLYPTGVIGEWLIILAPMLNMRRIGALFYLSFIVILLISYAYYFPVLYKYMWRQRRERVK